jgi:hypothetical protein
MSIAILHHSSDWMAVLLALDRVSALSTVWQKERDRVAKSFKMIRVCKETDSNHGQFVVLANFQIGVGFATSLVNEGVWIIRR